MGSIGNTVARSVESRGIVNGPATVNHLTNRVLSSSTSSGSTLPSLSSVSSSISPNSLFMASNVQSSQQPRTLSDMLNSRHIPTIGSRPSNSFIGRPYGASSNMMGLSSSFCGDSAPPPLDLSEFPSLTSRTSEISQPNSNPMVGRQPYGNCFFGQVGMVKQPVSETSEFTMSNEDFPALPGSQVAASKMFSSDENFPPLTEKKITSSLSDGGSDIVSRTNDKNANQKRGIMTTPDGKVSHIPCNMVTDQFGMIGLLMFIRAAETDSNLLSLAQGSDLTTLGLNLNSPENLYPNFGGPWAETPCRPQDIDYHVPMEYLTNQQIRPKLAPIKFERYGEDLLFYMFYSNAGDKLQIMAAAELYNRDWRYHKEERVWITRAPGMAPIEKAPNYERGTYFYFDAQNWRKVPKEFHLEYDKLEERPLIPSHGPNSLSTPTSSSL